MCIDQAQPRNKTARQVVLVRPPRLKSPSSSEARVESLLDVFFYLKNFAICELCVIQTVGLS